jgi:hypothetical protein
MATFEIMQCMLHPGTSLSTFDAIMARVFLEHCQVEYEKLLHVLNELHIPLKWKAVIKGYVHGKDSICVLTFDIDDDKDAVLFKLFYDYPMPLLIR